MSQRTEKVNSLTREVLGEAIQNLKDPRIGFCTVTGVQVTSDLRHAHVFVSVLGSEDEQQETLAALEHAARHLRAELGRQVRMRYTPELFFELDQTAEHAEQIESLIRRLHQDETD